MREYLIRCSKCGAGIGDIKIDTKNLRWVPTGRWCLIGTVKVQAFDPEAKTGTCEKCGTVIDYDVERAKAKERAKEIVNFT